MPHDRGHIDRVKKLALFIAKREGGDIDIIMKAVELHDIARDKDNHAVESAKEAREILKSEGYDDEFIEKVCHCIISHSFSSKIEPKTIEAKILSDADKLDAIGAIGIARTFMFAGEKGRGLIDVLKHFKEKLLKLDDLLYTKTAKEIAKERYDFTLKFYEKIKEELDFYA